MMKISEAATSSELKGIADDWLKDEDNGIWLAGLPKQIQSVWCERFYWIRRADRLAEQDQVVQPGGTDFSTFYAAWKRLYHSGCLTATDRRWDVLKQIESVWFLSNAPGLHQIEIAAWDCYMEAIADYHQPSLVLETLESYEAMLNRLAGSCFQLLPFLADHHRAIARGFGIVDQFYNNLRDLYEDTNQGICYFPNSVLSHFELSREDILTRRCLQKQNYYAMMTFWVERYLPRLRQRHLAMVFAQDLHPAWQCLIAWFIHRYKRIETVLRNCQYDFVAFAHQYWAIVQQDLEHHGQKLRQQSQDGPRPLVDKDEIAQFLQVHPDLLGIFPRSHTSAVQVLI